MRKINLILKLTLLIGVATPISGQTVPNVSQNATQSTCSNIVALSGARVNCSNLTPAQKKALADVPSILKMALENQGYLEAILAKLNEMPKDPSVNVQSGAVVSFGQQGGITAGQVVITLDDMVPAGIAWSQRSVAPVHPDSLPYVTQITLTPNKRIDSPTLALVFDGPVKDPGGSPSFPCAMCGFSALNEKTLWLWWHIPVFAPDAPAVITVGSEHPVRLLTIAKGPKPPI
jgi:hypothetical protein